MVLEGGYCEEYCKECGEKNTDKWWCKPCQINYFMKDFANWTSEDKEIDDLGDLVTMYSATWKDGPLYYEINDDEKRGWMRKSNERVNLKCLHNIKNNTDEFLKEVCVNCINK